MYLWKDSTRQGQRQKSGNFLIELNGKTLWENWEVTLNSRGNMVAWIPLPEREMVLDPLSLWASHWFPSARLSEQENTKDGREGRVTHEWCTLRRHVCYTQESCARLRDWGLISEALGVISCYNAECWWTLESDGFALSHLSFNQCTATQFFAKFKVKPRQPLFPHLVLENVPTDLAVSPAACPPARQHTWTAVLWPPCWFICAQFNVA